MLDMQQNNMKKDEVVILMNDEEPAEFNGVIEDVIEDMIVVKIKSDEEFVFYIDFQYCGLDEKYGIKKYVKHRSQMNYFIPLDEKNVEQIQTALQTNEENVEEYAVIGTIDEEKEVNDQMMIYSVDQQIDDYIEYYFKLGQNKNKVL